MSKSCATCAHSVSDKLEDGGVQVHCRRFPPSIVKIDDSVRNMFPIVRSDWWCGEFRASVSVAARKAKRAA